MLPTTRPRRLMCAGAAVPWVHLTPSLAQASFTLSPHHSYSGTAGVPVRESKGAQEGGAAVSVMAHLQALPWAPTFAPPKDTQGQVLNPHSKIKPIGQQSIRTGMPLAIQALFHLSLWSRMQQYHLSFKTQIPEVFLMLWPKIWLGLP